jgi:hypothetical protein
MDTAAKVDIQKIGNQIALRPFWEEPQAQTA